MRTNNNIICITVFGFIAAIKMIVVIMASISVTDILLVTMTEIRMMADTMISIMMIGVTMSVISMIVIKVAAMGISVIHRMAVTAQQLQRQDSRFSTAMTVTVAVTELEPASDSWFSSQHIAVILARTGPFVTRSGAEAAGHREAEVHALHAP
mmetsp:Transcript_44981/g.84487  ORF Transcript_44981/g.84487 Transcript_44981/m.84487 type:complete len:153 (-) Transcript_44981:22-480(-)